MSLTVGDYCEHKFYSWVGKCKIKSINFGTCELERTGEPTCYYSIGDLKPWEDVKFKTEYTSAQSDPLFCTCNYSDAKIVESSTQVQGSVEAKDKFRFCRTCKKEKK